MRNPHRPVGFTLIELLVVIAIILLIAALSIPALSIFLKGKVFNEAAQQVHSAFLRARSKTITSRETHYVLVYVADGSFTLARPSGGTKAIRGTRGSLQVINSGEKQKKSAKQLILAEGLSSFQLPEQVFFDPSYAVGGAPGFYVQFLYDGGCIVKGKADAPSTAYYSGTPNTKIPYRSNFDLVIRREGDTTTAERPRLYFDIIQGTGALRFRVWPK